VCSRNKFDPSSINSSNATYRCLTGEHHSGASASGCCCCRWVDGRWDRWSDGQKSSHAGDGHRRRGARSERMKHARQTSNGFTDCCLGNLTCGCLCTYIENNTTNTLYGKILEYRVGTVYRGETCRFSVTYIRRQDGPFESTAIRGLPRHWKRPSGWPRDMDA